MASIAADLTARRVVTSHGRPFTQGGLSRMLGGHRYGGLVEHHGKIVGKIVGERGIDLATDEAVQAMLSSRRRGRRPTGRFVLTGLLTCSVCQRSMNGTTARSKDGQRQRRYQCPHQLGGCGRSIDAALVKRLVEERMLALHADPDSQARLAEHEVGLTEARTAQLVVIDGIRDQLVELEVKAASGEIIREA